MKTLEEIFRDAAELVAGLNNYGDGACEAIRRALPPELADAYIGYKSPVHSKFERKFHPKNEDYAAFPSTGNTYWLADLGAANESDRAHKRRRKRNEHVRVLALLFAAEMARTGDIK